MHTLPFIICSFVMLWGSVGYVSLLIFLSFAKVDENNKTYGYSDLRSEQVTRCLPLEFNLRDLKKNSSVLHNLHWFI